MMDAKKHRKDAFKVSYCPDFYDVFEDSFWDELEGEPEIKRKKLLPRKIPNDSTNDLSKRDEERIKVAPQVGNDIQDTNNDFWYFLKKSDEENFPVQCSNPGFWDFLKKSDEENFHDSEFWDFLKRNEEEKSKCEDPDSEFWDFLKKSAEKIANELTDSALLTENCGGGNRDAQNSMNQNHDGQTINKETKQISSATDHKNADEFWELLIDEDRSKANENAAKVDINGTLEGYKQRHLEFHTKEIPLQSDTGSKHEQQTLLKDATVITLNGLKWNAISSCNNESDPEYVQTSQTVRNLNITKEIANSYSNEKDFPQKISGINSITKKISKHQNSETDLSYLDDFFALPNSQGKNCYEIHKLSPISSTFEENKNWPEQNNARELMSQDAQPDFKSEETVSEDISKVGNNEAEVDEKTEINPDKNVPPPQPQITSVFSLAPTEIKEEISEGINANTSAAANHFHSQNSAGTFHQVGSSQFLVTDSTMQPNPHGQNNKPSASSQDDLLTNIYFMVPDNANLNYSQGDSGNYVLYVVDSEQQGDQISVHDSVINKNLCLNSSENCSGQNLEIRASDDPDVFYVLPVNDASDNFNLSAKLTLPNLTQNISETSATRVLSRPDINTSQNSISNGIVKKINEQCNSYFNAMKSIKGRKNDDTELINEMSNLGILKNSNDSSPESKCKVNIPLKVTPLGKDKIAIRQLSMPEKLEIEQDTKVKASIATNAKCSYEFLNSNTACRRKPPQDFIGKIENPEYVSQKTYRSKNKKAAEVEISTIHVPQNFTGQSSTIPPEIVNSLPGIANSLPYLPLKKPVKVAPLDSLQDEDLNTTEVIYAQFLTSTVTAQETDDDNSQPAVSLPVKQKKGERKTVKQLLEESKKKTEDTVKIGERQNIDEAQYAIPVMIGQSIALLKPSATGTLQSDSNSQVVKTSTRPNIMKLSSVSKQNGKEDPKAVSNSSTSDFILTSNSATVSQMPRFSYFPAESYEKAKEHRPRHYDMVSLNIGDFKVEDDMELRCKFKVVFTKRQFMYDFPMTKSNKLDIHNLPSWDQMARITVNFHTILAMEMENQTIFIRISEYPSVFLGHRTSRLGIMSKMPVYEKPMEVCPTLQGTKSSLLHKIILRRKQARKLKVFLCHFDSRFVTLTSTSVSEGLHGHIRRSKLEEELELSDLKKFFSKSKKRDVRTLPQWNSSNPSGSIQCDPVLKSSQVCACRISCKSVRCSCVKAAKCCNVGRSLCLCINCDNPLNVLHSLGVDVEAAKRDECLFQNIYRISRLSAYLNREILLSCCNNVVKLYRCIPNTISCPNKQCGSMIQYSWCRGILCYTERYPRNHCSKCGLCGFSSGKHCQNCNKCYVATPKTTTCPQCSDAGLSSNVLEISYLEMTEENFDMFLKPEGDTAQ